MSRTRIITTDQTTLIAQLTITALLDSPVDKAQIALTAASSGAAGPAPVGYHGKAPGGSPEEH